MLHSRNLEILVCRIFISIYIYKFKGGGEMLCAVFMLAAILALQSLLDIGSVQQEYPNEIKVCDKKK